jgi:hypothetical protein
MLQIQEAFAENTALGAFFSRGHVIEDFLKHGSAQMTEYTG